MSTTTHHIGTPDADLRYPVLVGEQIIGIIFRWHGRWYALPAGTSVRVPAGDGGTGQEDAALYCVREFEAGRAMPNAAWIRTQWENRDQELRPLSVLDPRLRFSPRNIESAKKAWNGLRRFFWTPLQGYPGADNPWLMRCNLCGWEGRRYWSHLRGRNGNLPSTYRHPGCVDAAKVREKISAYRAERDEEFKAEIVAGINRAYSIPLFREFEFEKAGKRHPGPPPPRVACFFRLNPSQPGPS
ncbi:hypothetical protein [Streptomyces sp. NPDC048623]|uniref:hypothetical protein n=1 Tax=Streptomyces sp. NPDC048623 TaxID=3155761 RepID=UPI0034380A2B